MTKSSQLSAAERLFAPRFVSRGRPQTVPGTAPVAPKVFLTRAQRLIGTMHLPRKS